MVTFDVSLLTYFAPAFLLLFLWVILYAFMSKTKYITDNNNLNSIMAFVLALLTVQATPFSKFITNLIPFFVFGVFIVFILTFLFTSAGIKSFEKTKTPAITWTVILIGAFVLIWVGGKSWGGYLIDQSDNSTDGLIGHRPTNTDNFETNVINSLFNPKLAGSILFIAFVAIALMLITER